MSMFQIGLSGLQSTQKALEVTSNNISNSPTAGFKSGSAEFSALYNNGQRGGVAISDIREDFATQGEIVQTGEDLDLAITGQGFFPVMEGGRMAYTQAGRFSLDQNLNVVNASGAFLQGYGIDENGNVNTGVLTDLKVEAANLPARATENVGFSANFSAASNIIPVAPTFDPTDGAGFNFSQSTEIYDSLGNSHVLTQYFNHTGANQWSAMYFVDGEPLDAAALTGTPGTIGSQAVDVKGVTMSAGVVTMNFSATGQLQTLDGTTPANDDPATDPFGLRKIALAYTPGNGAGPMNMTLDMARSTQFGSGFAMYANEADGYTAGEFSGVDVGEDGTLYATFTNGESKVQGQLMLATFANVNGLEAGNNTVYYKTPDSGEALFTAPGQGTAGDLLVGAFMGSNVDISSELVDLMSFQQNYQANAKTISSADEMIQILFNAT